MAHTTGPGPHNSPVERSGTVLETDEDVRQALLSGLKGQQQNVSVEPKGSYPPPASTGRPASPFRPSARPPVPILTVFDDGKADGEVIRLREPKFTIGRSEGDLRFPLDGRMSSRHVEITHQVVGGLHRWVVTDLQSKHGMFVRVSKTVLADKAEFLVGNGRYRLDVNQPDPGVTADHTADVPNTGETQGWSEGPGPFRLPALTELLGQEIGNRILLVKSEYWIGSDPTCPVCRPDDPYCDARHVRLYRGSKGNWHAEHNKTQNGLWLRMTQITVESMIQFQVGEQRFKLKV
jgi:pSer/pThr/pTyr-binding forkhead associated (FHA) protein